MEAPQIVKVGRNDPNWSSQIGCFDCGAIVEVRREHLFLKHEWDIGGQRDEVNFACPCGVRNVLGDNEELGFEGLPKEDMSGIPNKVARKYRHGRGV